MRPPKLIAGLSIVVAVSLAGTAAHAAAPGLVDGTIRVGSSGCSWQNATTSDTPPNTLTVDESTVNLICDGDADIDLTNSPTITFDDAAGTATAAQIDVTGTLLGITCGYRVTNATVNRQGETRTYTGGPFTATKTSGSFLCPGSQTVDSATFVFH